MLGMRHCVYFRCLMNGTNHLAESDRRPLHLCPVDLRKAQLALGFDVVERYRALQVFWRSVGVADEARWIEQRLAFEEAKVPAYLFDVQRGAISPQQRPDILQILRAARIVHQSLELESDQPLRAHHAQVAERRLQFDGIDKEAARDWTVRIKEIEAFVAANVIRRIGATVQATVAQLQQFRFDLVGFVRVGQQIDILSGADHLVRGEGEPADQREAHAGRVQRGSDFCDLPTEAGCRRHRVY